MSNKENMSVENKELGISLDKKTVIAIITALVIIMAFVGVLTQVLPRGEYDVIQKDGYEQIVDGTYKELSDYKMPVWKILLAPILCFTSSYAGTGILIIVMVKLNPLKRRKLKLKKRLNLMSLCKNWKSILILSLTPLFQLSLLQIIQKYLIFYTNIFRHYYCNHSICKCFLD